MLIGFAGVWLGWLLGLTVFSPAQETASPAFQADRPAVLVLEVGRSEREKKRESRFVTELRLALDGITIGRARPTAFDFADLSMGRQIEIVRGLLKEHNALAAIWLTHLPDDILLLHLVAVSTGRALVRLIERPAEEGIEADLALSASELLGTAFMFRKSTSASAPPPALEKVVEKARSQAQVPAPVPPPAMFQRPSPWSAGLIGVGTLGLADASGPSGGAGGWFSLERRFFERGSFGLGLGGLVFPLGETAGASMQGERFLARLDVFWGLGNQALQLGPTLGARAEVGLLTLSRSNLPDQGYRWWNLGAAAGLELRWRLLPGVQLRWLLGVELAGQQVAVRRESDQLSLVVSPRLEGVMGLGFQVPFGSTGP